eukprot:gnl/TRDRNA2_/TRDRNA2_135665_c0_seq1.p1 gnl/TRDRNA2_/TRDRNA2_135665_c0~~gnl/TRDRNA2_/TRDRNA2_135665_c0_seq1.p1  ORF type:complete len:333 (+),score=37.51 gnl/TRDRNA2_/TRDRNA2_135665_c0_seq1:71-1069(+)
MYRLQHPMCSNVLILLLCASSVPMSANGLALDEVEAPVDEFSHSSLKIPSTSRCSLYPLHESAFHPVRNSAKVHTVLASDLLSDPKLSIPTDRPLAIRDGARHMFNHTDKMWTIEGIKHARNAKLPIMAVKNGFGINNSPGTVRRGVGLNVEQVYDEPNHAEIFEGGSITRLFKDPLKMPLVSEYANTINLDSKILQGFSRSNLTFGAFRLIISNQGGALPHFHGPALNSLFQGAKRWILYKHHKKPDGGIALTETQKIINTPISKKTASTKDYNSHMWLQEHEEDLAGYNVEQVYDFVQQEGDLLFVPHHWMHATIDLCKENLGGVLVDGY